MKVAVSPLQWSMKQRGGVGGSYSGTSGTGAEAASRAVLMVMASLQPSQWPLGESKNSWRSIWNLCAITLKACDTCTWHLLIDFILHLPREQCSVKVQRPCRPNRNLRWGSILEVAVECRVLDCGLWWQLPGFESQPLASLLGWIQAVGLSSLLSFPYFLDEGDNSTPCRELLEV